ncbi:MAG: hypothetical protein IPI67_39220 [Myxococcales bacterium]|nr:hypothetical protein [Myxococcales bacterium]
MNNLFVASADKYGIGGDVDATDAGNLELGSVAEALFEDPTTDLYRLQPSSPARDVGLVLSSFSVSDDHDGVVRDDKPDVGAFEYTDAPPPSGGAPGSGGASGTGGATGSGGAPAKAESADDGGCSCRTHRPTAPPVRGLLLAVLAASAAALRSTRKRVHVR